eukprot:s3286_g5.t1
MCEYVMHAMYPDIISRHVPAMPVTAITGEPQEHREREPEEEPEVQGYIFESTILKTKRSFFTPAPITADECNTEEGKKKLGKTRWEVATGKPFDGVSYPLGALVFYRSKGDGMAEPTTKPGLFAGWHLAPGLRYKGNVKILDYESVRERSHLHWQPRVLHEKEVYFPPTEYIEFPLALAAHTAMLQMTDEEKEVKKAIYDRSFVEGVLPYDVCIDAFPVDSPPPPPRHAYITWARRGESVGPTPKPILDGEETDYEPSIAPEQFPGDEVPECPPRSDDEELQPAAVTRQLPRSEVLSREEAIAAIKKEFDGIGAMGTWDLESVEEEESVKKRAIESGQTIHLADLLAICSEKHVELEPKYRSLKGRVCYRGDQAQFGTIPDNECLTCIDHSGQCHNLLWPDVWPQNQLS